MCVLQVRFTSPTGVAIPEERFFVTGVKACPPADVTAPVPSTARGDLEYFRASAEGAGLDVTAAFRGRHCRVQIRAWSDVNADGRLSSGDWSGTSAAETIEDQGMFGGNSVRAPDVALALVP